jgi:hypothetical protein
MLISSMKSNQERYAEMVVSFEAAIIDRLKEESLKTGGVYRPSTDSLKAAAFPALKEVIDSEAEAVPPMLAVAVWEAVLKTNESAFRQGLARREKAGTLPFKMAATKQAPATVALQYI